MGTSKNILFLLFYFSQKRCFYAPFYEAVIILNLFEL